MEQDVKTDYRIVCCTCLSSGRNLQSLSLNEQVELYQTFRMLMYDFPGDRFGDSFSGMVQLVCWECLALMKKFLRFKRQVQSAQEHLRVLALSQETVDHTYLSQSLSSLTTAIKADYDNVYFDYSVERIDGTEPVCTEEYIVAGPSDVKNKIFEDHGVQDSVSLDLDRFKLEVPEIDLEDPATGVMSHIVANTDALVTSSNATFTDARATEAEVVNIGSTSNSSEADEKVILFPAAPVKQEPGLSDAKCYFTVRMSDEELQAYRMQKFKIVQTIAKGRFNLTAVPESWENQGILRYPKHKWEKLRRDQYSTPEDNWRSINCIVKRKNIMSFEEAEEELSAMSDVSDTDKEISKQKLPSKSENKETDFNELALQAKIHKPPSTSKTSNQVILDPTESSQFTVHNNETILSKNIPIMAPESRNHVVEVPLAPEVQANGYRENVTENTTEDLNAKLTTLDTKVEKFIANQIIINLNQEHIMQKLSEISAQFDELIKRSSTFHLPQTEDINKGMKTIGNEEDLNKFEELLKDIRKADEMTKVYSVVCGEGKGRALSNAYALIDAMFDRFFLQQCSWAGGSRGETSKVCFKSYKRTINLFFNIIYTSDKQFTILECESFLKNILRNAKKRCESKQLKRSAPKKRQKRNELEQKDIEEEIQENIEEIQGGIEEVQGDIEEENLC